MNNSDYITEQDARFKEGWEAFRGKPLVKVPVKPPVFQGHPRFARDFSYHIAVFVIRVFHNRETEFYKDANDAIIENCRFYIENTDVRDDRDSFYWNISEICRSIIRYGKFGTDEPGLISPEAENTFLEMTLGYCHDISRLSDAEAEGMATWRIYESENHHVQRNSAIWQFCYILSKYGKGNEVLGDGGTVDQHFAAWSKFFRYWMRERAGRSMFVEIHSKCYGVHTIKNLYPLYDFSPDPELRRMTGDFLTLFWALWAEEQINGMQGGGQTRVYPDSAMYTDSETLTWAWYYSGIDHRKNPGGMDYVLLDCSYRLPKLIVDMIHGDFKRGTYVTESRPFGRASADNHFPNYRFNTEWGQIYRYTFVTPHLILGTLMCPQLSDNEWCGISSQNRFQGVVFRERNSMILPLPRPTQLHNLQSTSPTISYNAFWSEQCEGTLITQRCQKYAGGMRVWFSGAGGVSNIKEKNGWILTGCGEGYAALCVTRGTWHIEPSDSEKLPGIWVACDEPNTPVILETADSSLFATSSDFENAVTEHSPVFDGNTLHYHSIYGHDFVFISDADGNSTIDGEYYVKKPSFSFRSPFVNCPWGGDKVKITFDGNEMTLDFSFKE